MFKIKDIFLFAIMAIFVSQNSVTFADGSGTGGRDWPKTIAKIIIGAVLTGIVQIIINPEIISVIMQFFSREYAEKIKLEQLRTINESLRSQLEQLRIYCNDKKIIKAMEETYLKSCIQVMELEKKFLEKYAI